MAIYLIGPKTEIMNLFNIIKCGITCFTFQNIINKFIPDINIEPNADVLFLFLVVTVL